MKKILFIGDLKSNAGPANVNKALLPYLGEQYVFLTAKSSYTRMAELVFKLLGCSVLVVSGISRLGAAAVKVARFTGVKTVYIMHGCAEYESELNGSSSADSLMVEREREIMRRADLLLPVSASFADWVRARYTQYADKTRHLYNGIVRPESLPEHREKTRGLIVSAGGDRPTKNNASLALAVEQMQGEAALTVCGKLHHPQKLTARKNVKYTDLIPQSEFFAELCRAEVFVLNSVFEPFSLSVTDALACGCSVLISDRAGIADILDLRECDLIRDPNNTAEIAEKLRYLLQDPNCERISSALDFDAYSCAKQAERLTAFCGELL